MARLKQAVRAAKAQREQYSQLQSQLDTIETNRLKSMKTLLNLGSSFFVNARVPDTSRVMVHVGLGVHVEYTIPEAITFCDKKVKELSLFVLWSLVTVRRFVDD